jgi:hypothetical protein
VLAGNVHVDLCQLSYGSNVAKSYSRYDVNGFRFRSTIFEASCPLGATTNIGVVTRVIDADDHESKYYGVIKNIIEYSFAGNNNMKIVFFNCDWFDPYHGTRKNNFGMVEVKHARRQCGCDPFVLAHQVEQVFYMLYPCEELSAWWVVYRVNPRERLRTPDDTGYHKNKVPVGEDDEVYQDDESPCPFNINPDMAPNSLVGDANDVTLPEQRKKTLRKTKKRKILNILYISYYVIYILYYVLYISYYVFGEYSLVLVLNRMSKRLKSVTKKLFGGKGSMTLPTDTLFQDCSITGRCRAEMMRHMDPSLVGSSTHSQRDEVTFSFSYHFSNMKLLTSLHLNFSGGEQLAAGGGGGGHL